MPRTLLQKILLLLLAQLILLHGNAEALLLLAHEWRDSRAEAEAHAPGPGHVCFCQNCSNCEGCTNCGKVEEEGQPQQPDVCFYSACGAQSQHYPFEFATTFMNKSFLFSQSNFAPGPPRKHAWPASLTPALEGDFAAAIFHPPETQALRRRFALRKKI